MDTHLSFETRNWFNKASLEERVRAIEIGYQILKQAPVARDTAELGEIKSMIQRLQYANSTIISGGGAAASKGQIGENYVYNILEPRFEVKQISKSARSADILLGPSTLVEVKLYSSSVPRGEVEKFQRDLRAKAATGGLFISLTSKILGKKALEYRREHVRGRTIPVLYIYSSDSAMLILAASLILEVQKMEIQETLAIDLASLGSSIDSLSMVRTCLQQLTSEFLTKMNTLNSQILETEINLAEQIRTMQRKIDPALPVAELDVDSLCADFGISEEDCFRNLAPQLLNPPLVKASKMISCGAGATERGFVFLTKKTFVLVRSAHLVEKSPELFGQICQQLNGTIELKGGSLRILLSVDTLPLLGQVAKLY